MGFLKGMTYSNTRGVTEMDTATQLHINHMGIEKKFKHENKFIG